MTELPSRPPRLDGAGQENRCGAGASAAPRSRSVGARRMAAVCAVVAYRGRWGITASSALGAVPDDDAQRLDYERTRAVLTAA